MISKIHDPSSRVRSRFSQIQLFCERFEGLVGGRAERSGHNKWVK